MKRALYLNKFHIMHNGITEAVKDIARAPDIDEIVLGICSSQFSDKVKSPEKDWIYNCLDSKEREQVMKAALQGISKRIHYVPIPDTFPIDKSFPNNRWIDYAMTLLPDFQVLYSERDVEIECMKAKGKEIRGIRKHVAFSDHCIRDKISRGEIWKPFFLPAAADELSRLEAGRRYRELFERSEVDTTGCDHEWRTFALKVDLDNRLNGHLYIPAVDGIIKLWKERRSVDDYILSLTRTDVNMKLMKEGVKVKSLVKSVGGQESYRTTLFPYSEDAGMFRRFCKQSRFPMVPGLERLGPELILERVYDLGENPYLMHARVDKNRRMFTYDRDGKRAGIEHVELKASIMGEDTSRTYESLAIESRDREMIPEIKAMVGLSQLQPRNYVQFLECRADELFGQRMYDRMFVGG